MATSPDSFGPFEKRKDVELVGVFDPDPALHKKYGDEHHLADDLILHRI